MVKYLFAIFIHMLMAPASITSQYLLNYHEQSTSYCLSVGYPVNNNGSSNLFWSAHSAQDIKSSSCINWKLDDHYTHNCDGIYSGKFYVNQIGFSHNNSYANQSLRTLHIDPTIHFNLLPQKMPFGQDSQSPAYDPLNDTILLVGGQSPKYAMFMYDIATDSYTDHSGVNGPYSVDYFQRTFGEAWVQINDTLYTGLPSTFKLYPYEYSPDPWDTVDPSDDLRFTCFTSINDQYLVVAGGRYNTAQYAVDIYDFVTNGWLTNVPTLLHPRESPSCKVVNDYLYVIGDRGHTASVEKLYVGDMDNIDSYTFNLAVASAASLTDDAPPRSIVVNNFILIFGDGIDILDTLTDTISRIGNIEYVGVLMAPILVHDIIYLFGGADRMDGSQRTDLAVKADLNSAKYAEVKHGGAGSLRGIDEFSINVTEHQGILSHDLYDGFGKCQLTKYGDEQLFVLSDGATNPIVNGYEAKFVCNEEVGIHISIELYSMNPTEYPTENPTEYPTGNPTNNPFGSTSIGTEMEDTVYDYSESETGFAQMIDFIANNTMMVIVIACIAMICFIGTCVCCIVMCVCLCLRSTNTNGNEIEKDEHPKSDQNDSQSLTQLRHDSIHSEVPRVPSNDKVRSVVVEYQLQLDMLSGSQRQRTRSLSDSGSIDELYERAGEEEDDVKHTKQTEGLPDEVAVGKNVLQTMT